MNTEERLPFEAHHNIAGARLALGSVGLRKEGTFDELKKRYRYYCLVYNAALDAGELPEVREREVLRRVKEWEDGLGKGKKRKRVQGFFEPKAGEKKRKSGDDFELLPATVGTEEVCHMSDSFEVLVRKMWARADVRNNFPKAWRRWKAFQDGGNRLPAASSGSKHVGGDSEVVDLLGDDDDDDDAAFPIPNSPPATPPATPPARAPPPEHAPPLATPSVDFVPESPEVLPPLASTAVAAPRSAHSPLAADENVAAAEGAADMLSDEQLLALSEKRPDQFNSTRAGYSLPSCETFTLPDGSVDDGGGSCVERPSNVRHFRGGNFSATASLPGRFPEEAAVASVSSSARRRAWDFFSPRPASGTVARNLHLGSATPEEGADRSLRRAGGAAALPQPLSNVSPANVHFTPASHRNSGGRNESETSALPRSLASPGEVAKGRRSPEEIAKNRMIAKKRQIALAKQRERQEQQRSGTAEKATVQGKELSDSLVGEQNSQIDALVNEGMRPSDAPIEENERREAALEEKKRMEAAAEEKKRRDAVIEEKRQRAIAKRRESAQRNLAASQRY